MPLEVHNISFSYSPSKPILRDISFRVDKGKTLGIVGVSGSGKSTLLKIIAGFLKGEPVAANHFIQYEGNSIKALIDQGKFSYMFQEPTLMPNLNVYQNVALPFRIMKQDRSDEIESTIAVVGLDNHQESYPHELSGGMRTRVSLARSFVTAPKLLLLDEPFSSLDIAWKLRLYNELEILQALNNTTVVIVSHDLEEIMQVADQVIILSAGGTVITTVDLSGAALDKKGLIDLKQMILNDHKLYFN